MTGLSQLGSRNCAVGHTQAGLWHLRFGSKADIGETATDVRFTPESRHCRTPSSGPLCAKSGHSALRKKSRYSITSSARASTIAGTLRPKALAVLVLITSSNLVGC